MQPMILHKDNGWNVIISLYRTLSEGLIWFIHNICDDDEANHLLIRAGFGIRLKGQVKMTILLESCVLWAFSSDCV